MLCNKIGDFNLSPRQCEGDRIHVFPILRVPDGCVDTVIQKQSDHLGRFAEDSRK